MALLPITTQSNAGWGAAEGAWGPLKWVREAGAGVSGECRGCGAGCVQCAPGGTGTRARPASAFLPGARTRCSHFLLCPPAAAFLPGARSAHALSVRSPPRGAR